MGWRRESVMDLLVLGFTMRMRIGGCSAMVLDSQGSDGCGSWIGVKRDKRRWSAVSREMQVTMRLHEYHNH